VRGRGISFYKSVKEAEAKAKTMTSPLIIPSVLGLGFSKLSRYRKAVLLRLCRVLKRF